MKKLFFFFLFGLFMSPTINSQSYFFGADNIDPDNPCCIWIKAGVKGGDNSSWSVEIDGTIYTADDYVSGRGPQIYHCFEVNGTYTANLNVDGFPSTHSTEDVEITDCKKNCCEAPDASDLEITSLGTGRIEVCLKEREGCLESEATFRYRKKDTNDDWSLFGYETNCRRLGVTPCVTYEFQGGYRNPDCGQNNTEYSESIEFTAPGDCGSIDPDPTDCCSLEGNISTIQESCTSITVIVDGYTPQCNAIFSFLKGTQLEWAGYKIPDNSYTFHNLDPCEIYNFKVVIELENEGCENKKVLRINNISFDNCGCFDDSDNSTQNRLMNGIESNYNLSISPENSLLSYPNPFQSSFEVNFTSESSEDYEINLFDVQGKLVKKQQGTTQEGVNKIEMNGLDNLIEGIYIYKLRSGNKIYTNKLSKL